MRVITLLAASLTLLNLVSANCGATTLIINPSAFASGQDSGPADGIFDSFTDIGAVNNNGFTDVRSNAEFDLSGLAASGVASATLSFTILAEEGVRQLQLFGYAGDNQVTLADFSTGVMLTQFALDTGTASTFSVSFDVAGALNFLLANGQNSAGFGLREAPANDSNYLIMFVSEGDLGPQLTVTTVPAPAAAGSFISALLLLGWRRRSA